jgi:hypothetical protein
MKARDRSPAFTVITICSFPEAARTKQRIHSGKEIHSWERNPLDPSPPSQSGINCEFLSQSWYVSRSSRVGFSFMSEGAKMMA